MRDMVAERGGGGSPGWWLSLPPQPQIRVLDCGAGAEHRGGQGSAVEGGVVRRWGRHWSNGWRTDGAGGDGAAGEGREGEESQ
jgi:hypothetical protein